MAQNKILKKVFKKMDEMGWNLDDNTYEDFKETYDVHTQLMNEIIKDDEREEDEITWMCQFILDFLCCLEELGE